MRVTPRSCAGLKHVVKGVHARLRRAMDARKRAFDPRIHLLCKRVFAKLDGGTCGALCVSIRLRFSWTAPPRNRMPATAGFHIAVLPGDGIGPEVMAPALAILDKVAAATPGLKFRFTEAPAGAGHYRDTGKSMPASTI